MYRHSQLTLSLGAFGGLGFHLAGTGIVWSAVFAATAVGMLISASHIAVELGVPHVGRLLTLFHGRPVGLAKITPCPHCGAVHA